MCRVLYAHVVFGVCYVRACVFSWCLACVCVCMCVHVCARVVSLKEVVQARPDVCLALTSPLCRPSCCRLPPPLTLKRRRWLSARLRWLRQSRRRGRMPRCSRGASARHRRLSSRQRCRRASRQGAAAAVPALFAGLGCPHCPHCLHALPACIACMHCLPALVAFVPRPTATAARRVAVWLVQWLRRHMSPHGCLATSSPCPAQHRTDICTLLPVLPLPPNLYCRTPQRMMGTTLTLEMRQMRRGSTRPGGTGS